jgi:hypothetical protein
LGACFSSKFRLKSNRPLYGMKYDTRKIDEEKEKRKEENEE